MNLSDIVYRPVAPTPWAEGEKIPWDEPGFSARMLTEHLSQHHDAASRRTPAIDAHVRWIHEHLLGGGPTRILDLACGPGLYTSRLSALGHTCTGIDFSPAAIEYAQTTAAPDLACSYHLADIRTAAYGHSFGLVMLIHGELNVFRPAEARSIVSKARATLADDGILLIEAHRDEAVRRLGEGGPTWQSAVGGLFSARPHLRLDERSWDDTRRVATRRYLIVDAETAAVSWYAESVQAYTDEEYESLFEAAGFKLRGLFPSLDGSGDDGEYVVLVGAAT